LGRPALGGAAKSKTGGVRVTETENDYFTATYGSLGNFLKMKVNEELAKVAEMKAAARADISPKQVMK